MSETTEVEKLTKEDARVAAFRKDWKEDKDGSAEWRTEARNSYGFVAGDQWESEDVEKLKEEQRPAVTFNRTAPMVDAVSGLEINNRQSVRYYPREIGDVKANELLTATADWIRDETDAEDEESEAFKDAAICGVGVTETRMDYEEDPDGKVVDERRDPLMVWVDCSSRKRSFKDARRVTHGQWMSKTDIQARWPDKEIAWANDDVGHQTPGDGDQSWKYENDSTDNENRNDQALVLHYQCWKKEPYYRLFDPFQEKNVELSESDFEKLQKNGEKAGLTFARADKAGENDIAYVKQFKKVYYRGFYCGSTELEYGKSPIQSGFTFKFITGKRDRNRNCWYGIVRVMMDPQKWANKWLSQILHIINSNAKGGAFVEENALADKRNAEEQWAQPGPLIMLAEGGIEKIKERTPGQYPAGLDRLMHFAVESLPFVTGLNLEVLGLANRDQAGVLEAQRRKAAVVILAPLFASQREFRKEKGRLYLEFIDKFIPEGKIVRIVSEGQAQYVPFAKSEDVAKHDVVVDEAPDSPDFKEQVWTAMQEILPALLKQGVPIPASVMKYSPLPSEAAEELAQAMAGAQPLPHEVQQQIEQMQAELQKKAQENEKLKDQVVQLRADQQVEVMKLRQDAVAENQKLAAKMQEAGMDAQVERGKAALEAQIEVFKAKLEAQLEEYKIQMETQAKLKVAKIEAEENAKQRQLESKKEENKAKEGGKKESAPNITIHNHMPKGGKKTIKTPKGDKYTVEEE